MGDNRGSSLNRPWFLSTFFIILMGALWFFVIPGILALVLLAKQHKYDSSFASNVRSKISKDTEEMVNNAKREAEDIIKNANDEALLKHAESEAYTIIENSKLESARIIDQARQEIVIEKSKLSEIQQEQLDASMLLEKLTNEINKLNEKNDSLIKKNDNLLKKYNKIQTTYKAVQNSVEYFRQYGNFEEVNPELILILQPSIELPIHSNDVKILKKESRNIHKQIEKILSQYSDRYTTKANKAIYSLMVIALQSELQNILYSLKYNKIDESISLVKQIALKYLNIAGNGNKSIYGTLVKFIGEIESLFIDLVHIEYKYYVRKEQVKEEQRALKEQIKQEAAERKRLQEEQKKLEKEESKFNSEINNIVEKLKQEQDESKSKQLEARIKELQDKLKQIDEEKEQIVNLQNGKAGHVYIISNIGSFGEDVFKVGMTRRLDPQDRVKELGDASVPFPFDVHSFIFSENARDLEKNMHDILDKRRVNKVNLRKEFFRVSLNEIENIVQDLDPTAEFKRTILAQEYRSSIEVVAAD